MPKKRLSAIVDRAIWEKVIKGRAGITWDIVVEKLWKGTGGNQEETVYAEKFARHKAEVEERIEYRGKLVVLRNATHKIHRRLWGSMLKRDFGSRVLGYRGNV